MDAAGLAVSTTSLIVSTVGVIAALCLNEKGETEMAEESPALQYKRAKEQKKAAAKQKQATKMSAKADRINKQNQIRQKAKEIGYDRPIIMFNKDGGIRIQTEDGEQTYKLVPISSRSTKSLSRSTTKKPTARTPVARTRVAPKKDKRSWVAMEINSRNGESQAIVCPTMADAEARAMTMKKAHRPGSQPSKDCKQGYALMDPSKGIDVRSWFYGYHDGKLYRV